MKKALCLLPVLILLYLFLGKPSGPDPETEIRNAYQGYMSAVLNNDGAGAASHVSRKTIDWFGEILSLALTGTEEQVRGASLLNRMQVLIIRQRVPHAELRLMNATDLFSYAVDHGWVGKNNTIRLGLGAVKVDGQFGTGALLFDNQEAGVTAQFFHESGSWRFDLLSVMRTVDTSIRAAASQAGKTEDEYIFQVVEMLSGRRPSAALWEPVGFDPADRR